MSKPDKEALHNKEALIEAAKNVPMSDSQAKDEFSLMLMPKDIQRKLYMEKMEKGAQKKNINLNINSKRISKAAPPKAAASKTAS